MQTIWLFILHLSSSHGLNSQIAFLVFRKSIFHACVSVRTTDIIVPAITRSALLSTYHVSIISMCNGSPRSASISADAPLHSERIIHAISFCFYHLVSKLHLPIDNVGPDEDAFRSAPGAALPENGLDRLFISKKEKRYRD